MVEKKLEGAALIVRIVAVVFGIICLGLVVQELFESDNPSGARCALAKANAFGLDRSDDPCRLVTAVSIIGLVVGILFAIVNILGLVLNVALALIVLPGGRRSKLALADIILSVLLAILWLATGIYLASEWSDVKKEFYKDSVENAGNATVVFSFLGTVAWIIVAVITFKIRSAAEDSPLPA